MLLLQSNGKMPLKEGFRDVQGGIPKKAHDSLYREVLHTYGHQHILTFQQLHSAGSILLENHNRTLDTSYLVVHADFAFT